MKFPRTNEGAARIWAESILSDEQCCQHRGYNSVVIEGDNIYSFGRHFPMGVIVRDRESGRVKRVVVNSDSYPHRGFASTPTDQYNVLKAAREAVERSPRAIAVEERKLTNFCGDCGQHSTIPTRPKPSDPEPPSNARIEIPPFFHATDPGPEPIDDGIGCVAGRTEDYSYQADRFIFGFDADYPVFDGQELRPGEHAARRSGNAVVATRWVNGTITWIADRVYSELQSENKTCTHCKAFSDLHHDWRVAMHGGFDRRTYKRVKGYKLHAAMMWRFGSESAWREARRDDVRRVRAARKAHNAWICRNIMAWEWVSTAGLGLTTVPIPNLDADGYPLRKDEYAWRRMMRANDRARCQAQRLAAKREVERRQVARFTERIRRQRGPSFETLAAETAANLADIRASFAAPSYTTEDVQ